ncbi:MAG: hypothetical protein J7K04_15005 [Spirochaetales bacterium]|nr:hypothetical protein [Spirochaetales bacterium]
MPFIIFVSDNETEMFIALGRMDKNGDFHYYYIHDYQGNLFSKIGVTAIWGINSSKGRQKSYTFENYNEMMKKISGILEKRIKSGYKMFYCYPKNSKLSSMIEKFEKRAVS